MPAMAVEIFHNFTLLHDDIMDNAMVRRGRPSVHAKWGENVAILSGDAMLILAYNHLQRTQTENLSKVFEWFNKMAAEVCEGQQFDMDFETQQKVSVVDYMRMIELKTAALLAGSAIIGAILAGASDKDCRNLYNFALEVGLAFQLQDDLLDSYGDEALGKKIGGDILEGKQTYLMVQAMSRATEAQCEVLRKTHLRDDITAEQKIATVKALYDELEVKHAAEQQIEIRFERALATLDALSIEASRRQHLCEFARNLMGRKK
jgi:geranylgeranyl diphosphate synthase type II